MDYNEYLFINKLFVFRKGSDRAEVEDWIASHQRLIDVTKSVFPREMGFVAELNSAAERAIHTLKNATATDGFFYGRALSPEQLDELATKNSVQFYNYVALIAAGYRHIFRDYLVPTNGNILDEMISLISWKNMSAGPESIHSIIHPKLEIYEREANERAQELSNTVTEHRRLFDDQKLLHAQASEATAKAQVELTAAGHAFEQKTLELEDRSNEIDSEIRQLRADLDAQVARFGTEAARKLWGEREKQSRLALIASSVAIFLLIVLPILLAICMTPEVLHYLAQIVAASSLPTIDTEGNPMQTPSDAQVTIAAIGRLVIVTVPIFLYVWAIRLVVRFNSRSLLLLDDARLRLTMLDTFFHLIEKKGAVKEDRALVLNALFRPAPGHGDNVEPPNFTELVTKAISPGSSK